MPRQKTANLNHEDPGAVASSVARPKRRRPHSPTAWANLRPVIERLYIDLDMTLRVVMQRIEEDHGLHATEQMYKKRLKSWNISKHIKADEKEKILGKLLHDEPATIDVSHVRHDKLVRYAKSRVKSGTLDSDGLTMVVDLGRLQKNKHSPMQRPHVARKPRVLASQYAKARAATSPPPSLSLPDGPANLDMFLRSMKAVIAREREEWLSGLSFPSDGIFVALNEGLAHWRAGEISLACGSFSDAAQLLSEDIQGPVVIVSRITYCISSIVWGNIREKIFIGFARFMAKVALEKQGKDFPLTRMLKHLRREQSIDAQLAIWACALDDYQISQQNVVHWWNMAQRRWRWCLRSGKPELAARYCRNAIAEARRIGVLTSDMETEAQQDFEPTDHAPGPEASSAILEDASIGTWRNSLIPREI